jgi:hypothetical protein
MKLLGNLATILSSTFAYILRACFGKGTASAVPLDSEMIGALAPEVSSFASCKVNKSSKELQTRDTGSLTACCFIYGGAGAPGLDFETWDSPVLKSPHTYIHTRYRGQRPRRVPQVSLLRLGISLAFAGALCADAQQPSPPSSSQAPRVIFSRSQDSAAESQSVPEKPSAAESTVSKPARPLPIPGGPVTDVERQQPITFLSYDLEVHLQPTQEAIAVRARMVLRNDSDQPLHRLPLQISASLEWTSIRVGDKPAAFVQQPVKSDVDHTGAVHEAVIALPQPLAPKQSVVLDVMYEGRLGLSTVRLEAIGTPSDVASRSDWDRVTEDFVGLRGFGNVIWYPVVSVPIALGDGDKFFAEVADQRLRQSGAVVSMKVTEEFSGVAPNLAVLDGVVSTITPRSMPNATLPGIVTAELPKTRLGFVSPSLFLLSRTETSSNGIRFFTKAENAANTTAYATGATIVQPLITRWLSPKTRREPTIVDLPEAGDASFEQGAVLFTPIQSTAPDKLAGVLIHSLTHAHFASPYPWLDEGVAYFMGTLRVEQESGRDSAIAQLDNARAALSLAEPANLPLEGVAVEPSAGANPGAAPAVPAQIGSEGSGESLLAAKDAIYYRTKATYVLWMLRDLAGDDALAQSIRNYDPAADPDGKEFERLIEQASGKDLKWFFTDWVYHDHGLPDLSIAGVHPNTANTPGSYIVAVDVANSGNAEAEVPVSVQSASTTVTERLRVPAKSRITHRFLLAGQPEEVAVNDGTVPEVEASVHKKSLSSQPEASR